MNLDSHENEPAKARKDEAEDLRGGAQDTPRKSSTATDALSFLKTGDNSVPARDGADPLSFLKSPDRFRLGISSWLYRDQIRSGRRVLFATGIVLAIVALMNFVRLNATVKQIEAGFPSDSTTLKPETRSTIAEAHEKVNALVRSGKVVLESSVVVSFLCLVLAFQVKWCPAKALIAGLILLLILLFLILIIAPWSLLRFETLLLFGGLVALFDASRAAIMSNKQKTIATTLDSQG